MSNTFDSIAYMNYIAERLIRDFEIAGQATTPGLIGNARETEIRRNLAQILPPTADIGTGCVIDTYGHTSDQADIVIYEKQYCPFFSINNTPETTYFPCEGVIAIGEIKSYLNDRYIDDSFNKMQSVKLSKRHIVDPDCWRKYGTNLRIRGSETERFNQQENHSDQIFGFILCGEIRLKIETFMGKYIERCKSNQKHLLPNITVSLKDGIFVFINKTEGQIKLDMNNATGLYHINNPHGNFQFLAHQLHKLIYSGRTTENIPLERYILRENSLPANGDYLDF